MDCSSGTSGSGSVEDRLRGALLGLAAGDKIGGPLQMALILAESLGERSRFDAGDYGRRLLDWHSLGSFDTGPIAEAVFARAASGVPFQTAACLVHSRFRTMTAGCNPAHRCAPLGMALCVPASELEAAAREQASMTHAHPLAGDAAAAVALLIRALISSDCWAAALAGLGPQLLPAHSPREGLDAGGFSPHVLHAALHFVSGAASFDGALDAAVSFAGAANYCPVLVGALAGARWGASAVPPAALAHCSRADLDRVDRAAVVLLAQWTPRGSG